MASTGVMEEALKNAFTDAEKTVEYAGADVGEMVDKLKARGPEERTQAALKADRKKVAAEDKAEARKFESHNSNNDCHPIIDNTQVRLLRKDPINKLPSPFPA